MRACKWIYRRRTPWYKLWSGLVGRSPLGKKLSSGRNPCHKVAKTCLEHPSQITCNGQYIRLNIAYVSLRVNLLTFVYKVDGKDPFFRHIRKELEPIKRREVGTSNSIKICQINAFRDSSIKLQRDERTTQQRR